MTATYGDIGRIDYGTWSIYETGNPQPVFSGNVDYATGKNIDAVM